MKVRAIEGCHQYLTAGKIYDVVSISEDGGYWRVVNDCGFTDGYNPKNNFKLVENNPKIEVGSLWIHDNGLEYEVTAVGEKKALVKFEAGEYDCLIKEFGVKFKPKPKTVTMYFYWDNRGILCATEDNIYKSTAFTREIELP